MRIQLALLALLVLAETAATPALADEGLTPKEIVAVMANKRTQIRKTCYENAPNKQDTSVRVDVTVAANGVVIDAQQREPSGPDSIRSCVVAEVKKITFPASEKGGWFRWPFIFKGP